MSVYINNIHRIKRSASQQEYMQKLTKAKIFDGYKDILMISAIIGFRNDVYAPVTKAASDGVLMQFFSQRDYDIMDLIAYAHNKSQAIIKSDEKYEIFSAYANGGFPILKEILGLGDLDNITEDDRRRAIMKYLSILVSDDIIKDGICDSDLII